MVSELFCINTACGSLLPCQRCIAKRRTTAQAACSVVLRAWVCMVMIWAGQRFCPSLASMKKELPVRRDSRMRINSNHPDGSVRRPFEVDNKRIVIVYVELEMVPVIEGALGESMFGPSCFPHASILLEFGYRLANGFDDCEVLSLGICHLKGAYGSPERCACSHLPTHIET